MMAALQAVFMTASVPMATRTTAIITMTRGLFMGEIATRPHAAVAAYKKLPRGLVTHAGAFGGAAHRAGFGALGWPRSRQVGNPTHGNKFLNKPQSSSASRFTGSRSRVARSLGQKPSASPCMQRCNAAFPPLILHAEPA